MKIIISDIDGSINLNTDTELINLINKFINKGNIFVIATDKAINYVADMLALSNVDIEYYICNDGAVIFDRYFNVLYRKDIREDLVRPIVNMLRDDENIIETLIDTSHGFLTDTRESANGILARPYDLVKASVTLNNIILKYPNINGFINDNWLNIIDVDVSKYNAIEYLVNTYNYNRENIYVLGKDINDLDMVKKYKGYTTYDCSEDLESYSIGKVSNIKELINLVLDEIEKSELNDEIDTIF